MSKNLICVIAAFTVALALIASGCVFEESLPTAPESEGAGETVASSAVETAGPESEKVIIDNEQMKVTFQKVVDGKDLGVDGAFYVWLNIENRMGEEVTVSVADADVDGHSVSMVMTGAPLNVRPGNSGATGFIFPTSQLGIDSVKDAKEATFLVRLMSKENYDIVAESELVTIDLN